MIRVRAGLRLRVVAAVLAAGLLAAAGAAGLGLGLARTWERNQQRQRLEALLAAAGPDLEAACFLADRGLGERAVGELMRSPDLRGVVLRTADGVLASARRPGPGPEPPVPWTRSVPSPLARDAEAGQVDLEPEPGEVHRRAAAAAALAGAAALAAVLALLPVLVLALGREVVRPLDRLTRQAGRSEAGALLELPPGPGDDAIRRLVQAFNDMVRRVAGAAWDAQEAHREAALRWTPDPAAPGRTGVFLARQDGALEAWTATLPGLLPAGDRPPRPGTQLPALFGPAAGQAEACLAECAQRGRAVRVLALGGPEASGRRWLRLELEQAGPGWVQGAVREAGAVRLDGQHDPHAGALHGA
jgi:HAMP domain-containing protein